MWWPELTWR
ncbi:hypothetical protein TIFTF001_056079 [Ficus carica]|uniref:Uncharacterized protein n=1 Tax=Ficus carica TaxID=3494 RepID=A0AA88EET2_FICCA|nr:hypothetical protein TIFTF001_056079 [Ficus carica]